MVHEISWKKRIRSGHTTTRSSLKRFDIVKDEWCGWCLNKGVRTPETIEHIIWECDQYNDERDKYIDGITCKEGTTLNKDIGMSDDVGEDCLTPNNSSQLESEETKFVGVVRVLLSYDMGWTEHGTDSLNGYGAIIGMQSKKIIDYSTKNRRCHKCQLGHDKSDHVCRKNFNGSAKAIEANLGLQLMTNSAILKEHNLEIVVSIGENDSATASAFKTNCTHKVVKFADKNHTSKGVSTYKFDRESDPGKELNTVVIKYFHDCFTYCMATNKGNPGSMSDAEEDTVENEEDEDELKQPPPRSTGSSKKI
ncbi:hypothetical protein HCN44_009051 [Aphidius gifuensis]|uniref:Mutator-like transposase domain-containing protein n=1 Tax=Aphidius gifuensis TaxID=684658 RepID=A0A834XYN6_APHGI|nr:hypothetical protein HCN44_009051 [Aphidius gifuensis]